MMPGPPQNLESQEAKRAADHALTEQLLASLKQGDEWIYPPTGFKTKFRDVMVQHLQGVLERMGRGEKIIKPPE